MATETEQDTTKGSVTPPGGSDTKTDKEVSKEKGGAEPTERELELQKQNKALNDENKKRRLESNADKEKLERYEKALKLMAGEGEPDPVAIEKKRADSRIRRAYLKSAVVSMAAAEMHDADFAFGALEQTFAKVDVDLETGNVDKAAIRSTLDEVKKAQPFLFKPAPGQGGAPPAPRSPPDGGGAPSGGDPFKTWQQLKATPGREREATEFYNKNRAQILAHMK